MNHSLSRNEREILESLQANARQTNRALAGKVGLAPSTALDRVRDLERRDVITGYHAEVALPALGRTMQAMVSVRLRPKTEAIVAALVEKVWTLPETTAVFLVSGADDLLIQLSVDGADRLRRLVLEHIANQEGVVDETTSLIFEHRQKRVITALEAEIDS